LILSGWGLRRLRARFRSRSNSTSSGSLAISRAIFSHELQWTSSSLPYDAAVSGADPVTERPGFLAMLRRITNGIKTIIVESPDRFARDLAVQLAGHDMLKGLGIDLIPASAPDFFLEDTPTAVLVRQVLGAIAQFEKASLVAKLAARDRKRARDGECEAAGRITR
jgi:DNA invertase Pin-like site-specific DNA recombinase